MPRKVTDYRNGWCFRDIFARLSSRVEIVAAVRALPFHRQRERRMQRLCFKYTRGAKVQRNICTAAFQVRVFK